jgi:hypothetical protein
LGEEWCSSAGEEVGPLLFWLLDLTTTCVLLPVCYVNNNKLINLHIDKAMDRKEENRRN